MMTSTVNDLTTLTSTNMADLSSSLSTLLTTLHSNVLTNMASSTPKTSIPTSAPLPSDSTNSISLPHSTPPPSTSTPSLTSALATQTAALINSAIPYTTSYGETSNESNISSSLPEEERRHYLNMLQEDTTRKLIPTVVFLAIVCVVGLFGNSMVLLVYSKKARRNATDIFIMAIAAFDLVTNFLCIPGEIYDTFHYWDFPSPTFCKFRIYFNSFTTLTSALALLAVAFSRYKKVCRPFGKQTSLRTAKITTVLTALSMSIFAAPNVVLNGAQTRPTPRPDVFGTECSTDDVYVDTIWPLVYTGFLTLLFLSVCIPLIVFYILIGVQAWRHSKMHGIPMIHKTPTTSDHTMSETMDSTDETDRKSKGWSFFRKKKKYDITPGESSNDEDIKEEKADIKSNLTSSPRNKDTKKSVDEEDAYCTKMMRSPTKDKSHVNMPMLRELSVKLNRIRDSDVNTDEEKDTDEEAEKSKLEASGEMSPLLECSGELEKQQLSKEDAENRQNENLTAEQMSEFAASMQWVDITFCLHEDAKTEDQDDGSSRKKSSQSARVSRQNSLRQKLADTLTRAKKAKKESIALKGMENAPTTTATSAADGGFGSNHHISFQETVTETNGDIKRKRELKSCDSSSRNSPRSGTLTPKSRKSKTNNPHRRVLTRTTVMLIIISAVYVIAFVPHLVVMTCKFMVPNFLENMSDAGYSTYNIFLRLFFANSAANAIIYSLCDVRFREQALKIIRCKK